jgi:hypothetical protein
MKEEATEMEAVATGMKEGATEMEEVAMVMKEGATATEGATAGAGTSWQATATMT